MVGQKVGHELKNVKKDPLQKIGKSLESIDN